MAIFPIEVKSVLSKIDFAMFNDETFSSNWVDEYFFQTIEYEDIIDQGIDVVHGVSKLVFIPKKYNFVIKIPFKGWVGYCPELETDKFYSFNNAKYPLIHSFGDDYCRAEAENYFLAKKAGLDFFFSETRYFTTIDNIKIYVSEKAKSGLPELKNEARTYSNAIIQKFHYPKRIVSLRLISSLLEHYSPEQVKKLLIFLQKNKIGDLVFGNDNVGINLSNGLPVIIDYSDFYE